MKPKSPPRKSQSQPRNLCRRPFGKTPYLKKYTTKVAIQHNGRSFAHPSSPTAMDVLHEQGFRRADRWFVINLPLFRPRARRGRFHESPTGAANIGKVHAFVRRVQRLCSGAATWDDGMNDPPLCEITPASVLVGFLVYY